MEYKHISEINFVDNIGQRVFGIFLAKDVEIKFQKDGTTKYLDLTMCDKDVKIKAVKFGCNEKELEDMKNGTVYYAAIDVKPYAKGTNGMSCHLYNFDFYNEDPGNFIEWAPGIDEAVAIIQEALSTVAESIYKDLVYNILSERWADFSTWTAASGMHHNMLGGLLVHTAEVVSQAEKISDFWENKYGPYFINKELLLAGALLHDVAKTAELDVDRFSGSTSYSTLATLETHITMCCTWIDIEAYKLRLGYQTYRINEIGDQEGVKTQETLEFEQEAVRLLKHLILSHHGKKEYGSPIDMNTPEAYILNTADELSAVMFRYNKNFQNMKAGESLSTWLGGNLVSTYKDSTK